jgi:glutamine amidotransferase
MGNIGSVKKAFDRLRIPTLVSNKLKVLEKAAGLLLPGVGHFETAMKNLQEDGLDETITELVVERKMPILGICLGMQLLTDYSEEGGVNGLGLISANTIKFKLKSDLFHIPHMGWNSLEIMSNAPLFKGISPQELFYFVHSYYVVCDNEIDVASRTTYGNSFVSSFNHENIFGCQFHPEKSHEAGLKLLSNFSNISACFYRE